MASTLPPPATNSTNSGIVTDETSGERHIPESTRADGSTRKAIKIRPGYLPPEDVERYKNRTALAFRDRVKAVGVPGTEAVSDDDGNAAGGSAAGSKNAKRRAARKRAKATAAGSEPEPDSGQAATAEEEEAEEGDEGTLGLDQEPARGGKQPTQGGNGPRGRGDDGPRGGNDGPRGGGDGPRGGDERPRGGDDVGADVEREKKIRAIRKKLKQARDLETKKASGAALLPEQMAKVTKIAELVRELKALGADPDGSS